MNSIFHRVSIRKYQQCAVPDKLLTLLLRAAMAAPSAGNQQPWEFYIVRDRSAIQALSKATPYSLCAAQAPVVIVPCMRVGCLSDAHRLLDLSAATENLLLQADSLGLGACWMGRHMAHMQLCTQNAEVMAVSTVMTKLMMVLNVSFFICLRCFCNVME